MSDLSQRLLNIDEPIGKKFGTLTIVSYIGIRKRDKSYNYVCECGKTGIVTRYRLKVVQSCGCKKDRSFGKRNATHGLSQKKIYKVWRSLMSRCYDTENPQYYRYGGRGITVSKEWHELTKFAEDMGDPPKGLQIDRVDNNKGYSKENCRWATRKENMNNREANVFINLNGESRTVSEWCAIFNFKTSTIYGRLKAGWETDKLFIKPDVRNRMAKFKKGK